MIESTTNPIKRMRWKNILPWSWLIVVWLAMVLFCAIYGKSYLDSDMASEMVLADLLNQEGTLLSQNWYYSTEIRVIYIQIVYRLGLLLFPGNWLAARVFGQAILLALAAGAYAYFSVSVGAKKSAPWGAGAILLPFGFWQMYLVSFGGYYLPHITSILLSAGLVIRLSQPDCAWRTFLRICTLAVVAVVAGLGGPRLLMNIYMPLVVAGAGLLLMRIHSEPDGLKKYYLPEWRVFASAGAACIAAMVGYLINSKVLASRYHFTSFSDRAWKDLSLEAILSAWSGLLSLFGYQSDSVVQSLSPNQTRPNLFSLNGVLCLGGLAMAAVVVIALIVLWRNWRRLLWRQKFVTILLSSVIAVDGAIFAFTSGSHSDNCSYWVPILPLAFVALEAAWVTFDFHLPLGRLCTALLASVCLLSTSTATVRQYLREPFRSKPGIEEVCCWLLENGYDEGYATFWNSNILTELSNGQIECWTVSSLQNLSIQPWLQKTSHMTERPQEHFFTLIGPDDQVLDLTMIPYIQQGQGNVAYQDENGFTILTFESGQQVYAALE